MNAIQTARHTVVNRAFRSLRAGYYLFAFERTFPLKSSLERSIHDWELQQGKGDVPKGQKAWDEQYRTDEWGYLDRLDEFARYAVITGYIAYLKPHPTVLDVGCGEGVLFERYRPYGYAKYVGLDISEVAVAKLAARQDAQTMFFQADAETFQPAEAYDVIVFNETQYYFRDPLRAIERYAQALRPGGLLIISTYTASRRAMVILRQLKHHFTVLNETQTTQGSKSWLCTVLGPTATA